jgi:hypothetical protein
VSDPTDDEIIEWLLKVRADGDGLDLAPVDMFSAEAFDMRRAERQPCVVCGYRLATAAYIASTGAGNRWIDVCWTDYRRVHELNAVARGYPIG